MKQKHIIANYANLNKEEVYPQSDSPTATNDSLKLFLATVANQEFPIRNLDVTSAFLQGAPLDRNVYMEPPTEVREVGKIWKLKKSAYGLYDASRKWFLLNILARGRRLLANISQNCPLQELLHRY